MIKSEFLTYIFFIELYLDKNFRHKFFNMSMKDSPEEVIAYRARIKQQLKDEFRRKFYDPRVHARSKAGGYVVRNYSFFFIIDWFLD